MGLESLYGMQLGKSIYINGLNCRTKKRIVETIIHERVHYEYPNEEGRHVECVCDAVAEKHRKGTLTFTDLRNIIKSVDERYSDREWREYR